MVDLVAAAAGVLYVHRVSNQAPQPPPALIPRSTYDTVQAPPATVFLHALQLHIPTECRFTVVLPQNVQVYRACCDISIFLTLESEASEFLGHFLEPRMHTVF